jgi:phosphoglycolate phosphatase
VNDPRLPPHVLPQALLLDLDGTLVDTRGDFLLALNGMLAELALPPVDEAFVETTVGKGSEHLLRSTLRHVAPGDDPDLRYPQAWAAYERHYLAVNGQASRLFPGVAEGITALRARGLRLGCLTNKPTHFARPLLQRKGLLDAFVHVWGGDAFERRKPDPLPLLKACEALGTLPATTWMVGDSRNDAQAAHAAGCPVWLMTYGFNHGEPVREVPAHGYLDRLDHWPALGLHCS